MSSNVHYFLPTSFLSSQIESFQYFYATVNICEPAAYTDAAVMHILSY